MGELDIEIPVPNVNEFTISPKLLMLRLAVRSFSERSSKESSTNVDTSGAKSALLFKPLGFGVDVLTSLKDPGIISSVDGGLSWPESGEIGLGWPFWSGSTSGKLGGISSILVR